MENYLPKALPFCPAKETRSREAIQLLSDGREPETYYLQEYRGAMHNQSYCYRTQEGVDFRVNAGSCVAESFTAILEKIEYHKGGEIHPSVSMLYGSAGIGVDDGMYNIDAYNSLKLRGAMPFQYLKNVPYMDIYSDSLSLSDITHDGVVYKGAKTIYNEMYPTQTTTMQKTKLSDFWEVEGRPTSDDTIGRIQRAIKSTNEGVIFTYSVDSSFDTVGSTGILKNADYAYSSRGSHVSVVVGWVYIGNILHWIIQNSWGQYLGDMGYVYMPYNWIGLNYYGVIKGTTDAPAKFADIPKKARVTTTDSSNCFEWDNIPNAVSYDFNYRADYWWKYKNTLENKVNISTSSPMQFQYRAVYADGSKGMWSTPTRLLAKVEPTISKSTTKTATSHTFTFTSSPVYLYDKKYTVTNKNGVAIGYTVSDDAITVANPSVNDYYEIKIDGKCLVEAQLYNLSKSVRIYGDLDWQYMKDDANKEVKITAQEWNDTCERIEYLAKDIRNNIVELLRVQPGEDVSAITFNGMLSILRSKFSSWFSDYIKLSLIPVNVASGTPITKQHFIQLRNAINSISYVGV